MTRKPAKPTNGRNHRARRTSRSRYKGVVIRTDLRLAIYLRDRFTCLYCLRDLHGAAPSDLTLDHLVADSDGGSNDPANLVTACRHCNCQRQDTPLRRFCGPETRAHVRRNTGRSIARYRRLAKAILAGEADDPRK